MSRYQKYVEERLKGATLDMKNATQLVVAGVGDYEPADPSVGIWSGFVDVTTEDGGEYLITDDGSVYAAGGEGDKIGIGPELQPDYD